MEEAEGTIKIYSPFFKVLHWEGANSSENSGGTKRVKKINDYMKIAG